jgi:hypothetical protein
MPGFTEGDIRSCSEGFAKLHDPSELGRKRHFLAALFGGGYGIKLDLR